jgi:hypothetical protein
MENETNKQVDWNNKTELELLELVYTYATNGLRFGKSQKAREWLRNQKLSVENTMACFNSGQLHHRKEKEFKEALERIGFMKASNVGSNCDSIPYTVFGNFSIMFPLRNEKNEIVNFFSVGLKNDKSAFLNMKGLYPGYPSEQTRRLFVVDTVLDAATILEAKVLDNREAVISLYDGVFLEQHVEIIKSLNHLTEVIQIKRKK